MQKTSNEPEGLPDAEKNAKFRECGWCSGIQEYLYGTWFRCRTCGAWEEKVPGKMIAVGA